MATMLTASPSPRINPSASACQTESVAGFLSPSLRRENLSRIGNSKTASPIVKPHSAHVSTSSLTSPSQPQPYVSASAHAQSQSSQTWNTSSSSLTRSQCPSPSEQRSHLPSVRSVSTQTSLSPIRTIFRPSHHKFRPEVVMVDAQTQYSPPRDLLSSPDRQTSIALQHQQTHPPDTLPRTPTSNLAHLHLTKSGSFTPSQAATPPASHKRPYDPVTDAAMPAAPSGLATTGGIPEKEQAQQHNSADESSSHRPPSSSKRDHATTVLDTHTSPKSARQNGLSHEVHPSAPAPADTLNTPSKKPRPADPEVKIMPLQYELCDTRDLVVLISSMLMELIRYNDTIPLSSGSDQNTGTSNLTRFHSRAPPGISVVDYLQRLTTYATLSPPILLSMVYYIDRLASFYPAFTISSLTVHRFLITAATVASKGLSDSFWTNKTYAKVGGVSVKELALLELEFLVRVQWRIVPRPETLVDYYRSLVGRSIGYRVEGDEENSADEGQEDTDQQE